jgi:hypothetical protein
MCSFTDLKRKVEAGDRPGAAIHTLKPNVDADAEERRAEDQALSDLQGPRGYLRAPLPSWGSPHEGTAFRLFSPSSS